MLDKLKYDRNQLLNEIKSQSEDASRKTANILTELAISN